MKIEDSRYRVSPSFLFIFGETFQHKPLLNWAGSILGKESINKCCNSEQLSLTSRNDALVQTINARYNEKYPKRHKIEIAWINPHKIGRSFIVIGCDTYPDSRSNHLPQSSCSSST